jgi:hypothetical protein
MTALTYLLDTGDGSPPIACRDAHQALLLARLMVAFHTGTPAREAFPPPP